METALESYIKAAFWKAWSVQMEKGTVTIYTYEGLFMEWWKHFFVSATSFERSSSETPKEVWSELFQQHKVYYTQNMTLQIDPWLQQKISNEGESK